MGQMISGFKSTDSWPVQAVCWLWMLSAFLLPSISFSASMPAIEPSLILVPLMLIVSVKNFRETFRVSYRYILVIVLCALMLLVSMAANGRIFNLRDDFELFKLAKYCIVFFFVAAFFSRTDYMPYLRGIFVLVFIFNILHYFNLFGFHYAVEKYYGSEGQVQFFGFNTLGQPDTKRLLGTMGNPNYNALLFTFFMIQFFPQRNQSKPDWILFMLALLGFIFCQSRTAYFAMLIMIPAAFWLFRSDLKIILTTVLGFGLMYGLNVLAGNYYVNSLADQNMLLKSNSVMGRIETWKHLWKMVLQKPVFGYGPYKEYFYERNMYAESEYVQSLWRMGFAGFPFFLAMLFWPLFELRKKLQHHESKKMLLFMIVFSVCCFTNNPFSNTSTILYLAIITGMFYGKLTQKAYE